MENIVQRYKEFKDKKDFSIIYRNSINDLYRFILSRCGNEETTREVLSDTYYSLIDLIHKFDSRKSKFKTFLFGIALNKLRQKWDKEKVNKFFALDEEITFEEKYIPTKESKQIQKKLNICLKQLNTIQLQVITKRFFDLKNIKEVSEELKLSVSNVTTIQNRAINKLRVLINK